MQSHVKHIISDRSDVKLAQRKETQNERHNDIKAGLADVDTGRVVDHLEILEWVARLKKE